MHKILLPSHGHVGGLRLFHGALSLLQSPGSCSSSELCCCLSIYEQGLKEKKKISILTSLALHTRLEGN